jgi:hypothetical protein
MASFIVRMVERSGGSLPTSPPDAFPDDDGTAHEASIDRIAAAGIVAGGADGRYQPGAAVTRGQMATFLVAALDHRTGTTRPPSPIDHFRDDDASPHEQNIDTAAAAGLTGGTTDGTFAPGAPVRRAQMASFLARALDVLTVEAGVRPPR